MLQPRKVLCLDWDKRSLRMVVARIGGGRASLEDAHAHRLPPEIDASDPEKLGRFIAHMLERHRIRQKRVIVDVPRDQAVINRLRLPPTPLSELAAAVRFQAQRELPFPIDEAEIDYVIMTQEDSGAVSEVLLAGVRRATLDAIVRTCEHAGLTPTRIGLRPYANLISVNQLPAMSDQRVLFLDIGPASTEIDVIHGRKLAFSRSANVGVPFLGGELVSDDSRVSSKAELSEMQLTEEAESEAVDDLLLEVTRTLQAFRAAEPDPTIDQIVIAGGTGLEHALLEAMDERFGLPVTLFDPTLALGVEEREAAKLRAFASTLGLAWGLAKSGLLQLDFLNPKRPPAKHASLKRRMRVVGLAAAMVLVAGVGWAITTQSKLSRTLGGLESQNRDLRKELLTYYEVDNKIQAADHWEDASRMCVQLDHLLNFTQSMVLPGRQMIVTDYRWSNPSATHTLTLACGSSEIAQQFVDKLNAFEDESGRRPYEVSLGTWRQTETVDPKFKGRIDVYVKLVELEKHENAEKDLEKKLKRRLLDLRRLTGQR